MVIVVMDDGPETTSSSDLLVLHSYTTTSRARKRGASLKEHLPSSLSWSNQYWLFLTVGFRRQFVCRSYKSGATALDVLQIAVNSANLANTLFFRVKGLHPGVPTSTLYRTGNPINRNMARNVALE